jgi:hypothetical protein
MSEYQMSDASLNQSLHRKNVMLATSDVDQGQPTLTGTL